MASETCPPLSVEDWPALSQPVIKCKIESTIPFHRLPLLVQVQVIRTMSPKDWINLAMTSKRNERVVKLARLKPGSFVVELCHDACIELPSFKLVLCYDKNHRRAKKPLGMMTREDMKTWLNQPFSSMIENAGILYQKIQNVFVLPNNDLQISFCTDIKKRATIQELLSNPVMKSWKKLAINGNKVSSEDLKMIMDTATLRRTFKSKVKEMPLDFRHENAFKFFYQNYYDARWVKIEDLYGLRDLVYVTLYMNSFTQEQRKSFVDYWVNSEVDMFSWIEIFETANIDFENLIDGFLGLQGSGVNSNLFLTLAKSFSNRRKKTLLRISYDVMREYLLLEAWDVNEKYTPSRNEEKNKKFENVGKILTLLHKKKELEDLWEVASEEAKMELSGTIDDLIAELSAFNVIFIDGEVTHNLF